MHAGIGITTFFYFVLFCNPAAPPLKLIDLPGLDQRIVDDKMVSSHKLCCSNFLSDEYVVAS